MHSLATPGSSASARSSTCCVGKAACSDILAPGAALAVVVEGVEEHGAPVCVDVSLRIVRLVVGEDARRRVAAESAVRVCQSNVAAISGSADSGRRGGARRTWPTDSRATASVSRGNCRPTPHAAFAAGGGARAGGTGAVQSGLRRPVKANAGAPDTADAAAGCTGMRIEFGLEAAFLGRRGSCIASERVRRAFEEAIFSDRVGPSSWIIGLIIMTVFEKLVFLPLPPLQSGNWRSSAASWHGSSRVQAGPPRYRPVRRRFPAASTTACADS
ncbi:hypothetical protein L1887_61161 [Cichorium endivia]|nr:hypothetical protein L1887_61161 [Cichorium endivia]